MFAGIKLSRVEEHSVIPGNIETDKCHAPRPAQTQEKLGSKKKLPFYFIYPKPTYPWTENLRYTHAMVETRPFNPELRHLRRSISHPKPDLDKKKKCPPDKQSHSWPRHNAKHTQQKKTNKNPTIFLRSPVVQKTFEPKSATSQA